jgi:dipeptidyl aminopeptidase/acylaminoacyl peptidase
VARNIIDERSETFIWTAHNSQKDLPIVSWLENTDELIHISERDGWRHLYLVQTKSGTQTPITKGEWVVRGIDKIDEANRQIWFRASGVFADQDPYFIHFCRVNFDGTGFTALTAANGSHSVTFSPDRRFLIDNYSRVDLAPVHELRRVEDGQLICQLESADISELEESGWVAPAVFSTKGRDGKTDIWGIICRPKNFDPTRRYPIIEDIYAGPHDANVPKRFRSSRLYSDFTDRGFIVVQIDGMGTAHRSKAFHDVCWKNLKDAGFPDRIRWIQDAAKKYPSMDTSRVGIYGTSAGGQNAAGALLFHGDFYKAAVASCGCHDNRMDKASWNEQWMGYPVGPHYSESSNIDNANLLKGNLLLIVGELDSNVPPESTLRFVDALVKADKNFDMLFLPGVGHSDGGEYGQRRRLEFFQRCLMEAE